MPSVLQVPPCPETPANGIQYQIVVHQGAWAEPPEVQG